MRFSIYGRYLLDVERHGDRWVAFRVGEGTRREDPGIFVPSHVPAEAVAGYLEDLLHEEARPGAAIRGLG
jgi:hypothetical protein